MTDPSTDIAAAARRVLGFQLLSGAVVAGVFLFAKGYWGAVSALYGAGISITTTLLLRWGFKRAEAVAVTNPSKSKAILYLGAVQRFVVVLALLLLGLAVLKVDPLAAVVGFGLAHFTNLVNLRR